MDEISMEVPAVQKLSTDFKKFSDLLNLINKALEVLANILKTTAFIGLVGGAAVLHFIETIKPQIKSMADLCAELSRDLSTTVKAFQEGDMQGANLFMSKYGGV